MVQLKRAICTFLTFTLLICALCQRAWTDEGQPEPGGELIEYVNRADDSFGWREVSSGRAGQAQFIEYILTSQTWRGIAWKHQLFVLRPTNMSLNVRHGLLFVHGGRWKAEIEGERRNTQLPREAPYFVRLAESIRAPVAILRQVPFQPMFDRREDALIAYTFDQYMRTDDSDWPLLLPMVKSAVRAMDAVQRITSDRWGVSIESFTVSGASKRGWTSWLTAAVDHRVMAVAPMVIDVLNMSAQMDHQRATWGELSDEIRDYAALDIPTQLKTERGQRLLAIVDPFSYRAQLTKPKLILLSTNDRYWPLDALSLYWRDLPSPKHVLYVPNQGHGLRDVNRVVGGLSAVHRYAAEGKPLPSTRWSFDTQPKRLLIRLTPERTPKRVLIWTANSATRDFREARWSSKPCKRQRDGHLCSTERSKSGYTAAFAETSYQDPGALAFSTSTTVCLLGPKTNGLPAC